ncbi:16S rRNA (guanine(966)-N(2))-methyltransferase RsmD [Sphingosinicella sp. CPCC 101087]|uniref:16S rRNA (guanine(966)-N(2))-methyltransferase RsmD n=1 Tax=Sphingosinicella sp. CPCC 101087 TaxID=2497754 RepID=UPI00101E1389|nr:16S rRNA (guanine(966)-N(2))-methyltransferase RsmD [Sphingosinicella sp. CPCC 101087]
MRIIAGAWRGRVIEAPLGQATRPTSDRAREGLFSMLLSRIGSFEGLQVADLFAGTGALGLEALSRGAESCLFVEKDRAAVDTIRRNASRLGAEGRAELRAQAVEHAAPPARPRDLVFMDPPYGTGLAQSALDTIAGGGWLAGGAWVSLEIAREEIVVPQPLAIEADRRFGKARILLLRAQPG